MKKVMMLALMVLGTTAMVNAQTAPTKTAPAKEVKMGRHKKEHKKEVKAETKAETKTEASQTATAKPKK